MRTPDTPRRIDERIYEGMRERVRWYGRNPAAIDRRLDELAAEWDVQRVLGLNAGVLGLVGLAAGVTRTRWALLLPGVALGFLVQHAVQGWSPPLTALRRLGFRTAREIDAERHALRLLRGDFDETPPGG